MAQIFLAKRNYQRKIFGGDKKIFLEKNLTFKTRISKIINKYKIRKLTKY